MPATLIGKSQFGRPSPGWYRRLANALIIFIIPATTTLVSAWGLSDKILARTLLILSYLPAVIKGIGTVLGNGQEYAPAGTTDALAQSTGIDNPKEAVKSVLGKGYLNEPQPENK
jgi:hypothetical protein